MLKFCVFFISSEFEDGNSVIQLEAKALKQVINNHHVFEVPVFDDSEVLNKVAFLSVQAVLSG